MSPYVAEIVLRRTKNFTREESFDDQTGCDFEVVVRIRGVKGLNNIS